MPVMVRPERVVVSQHAEPSTPPANVLPGHVDTLTFRGARTAVLLDIDGLRLEAEVANISGEPPDWLEEGADVIVLVSPRALRVLATGAPATEAAADPAPANPGTRGRARSSGASGDRGVRRGGRAPGSPIRPSNRLPR